MDTFANARITSSKNGAMPEGNLSKIEVLLDKVNLVVQAIDGAEEPEPYDLRLLEKYLNEAARLASEMTRSQAKPSKPDKYPNSESPQPPEQTEEKKEVEEPQKSVRITPINEQPAKEPETEEEKESIRFVTEEPAREPLEKAKPDVSGDSETYDEIFKQLEEMKKNRAKYEETAAKEAERVEKAKEKPTPQPETKPESKPSKPSQKAREEDDEEVSLNERFRPESADLAERLKQKPIASLVHEIDLNDKFWFINELFDGDGAVFTKLLRQLDQLSSFDQARELVEQETEGKFDWSEKDRAKQKFYNILQRRF